MARCGGALRWLLPHYAVYGLIAARHLRGLPDGRRLGARRLRPAAGPDAQDPGGVPAAHAALGAAAARRRPRRSRPRTSRSSRRTGCSRSARRRRWSRSSATVDARDAYTAGHSRRVQEIALAIGRELDLSQAELELLGHAALFHDIGKLAIPGLDPAEAVAASPSDEWALMAQPRRRGRLDHQPPRLPRRRRTRDPPSPRALRRHAATRTASPARRSRSAPASSMSPTRSTRCSRPVSTARHASARRARRAASRAGHAVLPAVCGGARSAGDPRGLELGARAAAGSTAAHRGRVLARSCSAPILLYHCWRWRHGRRAIARSRRSTRRSSPRSRRDPQALLERADPGRADGVRPAARQVADDEGVRSRP